MTTVVPPTNGTLAHRVARLEGDVKDLRDRVDRYVLYLFGMFIAVLLSVIGTLVTAIIYR